MVKMRKDLNLKTEKARAKKFSNQADTGLGSQGFELFGQVGVGSDSFVLVLVHNIHTYMYTRTKSARKENVARPVLQKLNLVKIIKSFKHTCTCRAPS